MCNSSQERPLQQIHLVESVRSGNINQLCKLAWLYFLIFTVSHQSCMCIYSLSYHSITLTGPWLTYESRWCSCWMSWITYWLCACCAYATEVSRHFQRVRVPSFYCSSELPSHIISAHYFLSELWSHSSCPSQYIPSGHDLCQLQWRWLLVLQTFSLEWPDCGWFGFPLVRLVCLFISSRGLSWLLPCLFSRFVFIMGTSMALSFRSALRRGVSRWKLIFKVLKRTAILFLFGLMISNASGKGMMFLSSHGKLHLCVNV